MGPVTHARIGPEILATRSLTYSDVGVTTPALRDWQHPDAGRPFERTVTIGRGDPVWDHAAAAVMRWEVKTRSGFEVTPLRGARNGESYWLSFGIGPLRVLEPARVVDTVETGERCGFAYGTLEGHPVSGEEAFIVHRVGDEVRLTIRSVTRPGRGAWRLAFPLVLIAQVLFRRRYLRALLTGPRP